MKNFRQVLIKRNGMQPDFQAACIFTVYKPVLLRIQRNLFYYDEIIVLSDHSYSNILWDDIAEVTDV